MGLDLDSGFGVWGFRGSALGCLGFRGEVSPVWLRACYDMARKQKTDFSDRNYCSVHGLQKRSLITATRNNGSFRD